MGLFRKRSAVYLYDPESLSYEKYNPTFRDRVFAFIEYMSTSILISAAIIYLYAQFFDSPMEALLRKDNAMLQEQYELLDSRLTQAFDLLESLQQRDESLYRAIFQAESIPEDIRKSGFGGANRYENIARLPNSELATATTRKIDMLEKQIYVQSNSLDELVNLGKRQEERLQCIPAIQPVSNKDLKRLASGYGFRIDPIYRDTRFHAGMDFTAREGTEIYATGNGKVIYQGYRGNYGNCIEIDHGFGFRTLYAHLSTFKVRIGNQVIRGEVIGAVGNTGKSTGPHLHYEVILHGKHDNPAKYYFMDLTPEQYTEMIRLAVIKANQLD
ncbi:MAG: M23 family metallopeptidase [Tannerellaceae bacterium]|nr:M23 family metallopeptidase [Tannerellaceae bacterium]